MESPKGFCMVNKVGLCYSELMTLKKLWAKSNSFQKEKVSESPQEMKVKSPSTSKVNKKWLPMEKITKKRRIYT